MDVPGPSFRKLRSSQSPEELRAVLADRVADPRFESRVRKLGVLAWMAPPYRRWWSPSLDLLLRSDEHGTVLVARVGPHASLVTSMYFGTILLAFLVALSATWSWVQVTMGEPPFCLAGSCAGLLGIAGLWAGNTLAAWFAREQVELLWSLVDGLSDAPETGSPT